MDDELCLSLCELKEAFDLCDMNSNGFIKAKELNQVLKSIGQNPTQEELKIIFREISIDDTKDLNKMSIDFPEFLMTLIRCMKKNVFNYLKNKDVYENLFKNDILDVQKMVRELRECGINITKDDLNCLIDESHLNVDDDNDRHEFKFLELVTMLNNLENLMDK